MMRNIHFSIQEGPQVWSPYGNVAVYAYEKTMDGRIAVAQPAEFKLLSPEEMQGGGSFVVSQPLLSMDKTAAQSLMDELWKVGVRPSEGSGSAGSLAATERHLADMRTIAFKKAGVHQPASK